MTEPLPIIFVVEGVRIAVPYNYISRYPFFQALRKKNNSEQMNSMLPEWLNRGTFDVYIELLRTNSIDVIFQFRHNVEMIRKLLWLSHYFDSTEIELMLINKIIIPNLNKENCLVYIREAFIKLKS